MDYTNWRNDIFGQTAEADPVMLDLLPETNSVSADENLEHVNRALTDPEIHTHFCREQIGIGLQLIFSNCCGYICFCYLEASDEPSRVAGIRLLSHLYTQYFDPYCKAPVESIGNNHLDGGISYLCYMFWDIFILYPKNASPAMISAALEVMASAIEMQNDNCIVSAIHGLGHWAIHEPQATQILEQWLRRPTTKNALIIDYAQQAKTGCIL